MGTPTLYQWPPALGTESIYPRCVVFQRIGNIAKQEIKVVNVKIPQAGPDFPKELVNRLAKLPILEADQVKYHTSSEILEYLITKDPSRATKAKLVKLFSAHSFIVQQWANESFVDTLVYARWKRTENFERFVKNVKWDRPLSQMSEEIKSLRNEILRYLRRTPVGSLNDENYKDLFKKQLWSLNHILSGQEFLEPMVPYPTMTDLNTFMVVQGLLSPDLEEAEWIKENYQEVFRWAKQVDTLTSMKL